MVPDLPAEVELIEFDHGVRTVGNLRGKIHFQWRGGSQYSAECNPLGLISDADIQRIAADLLNNKVLGDVGNLEWRV